MATALYRRYRPETFAEMIGQGHVTEPLMTALRSGRIGHAYLFSGPRGCGKTTSARILARCLNCAEGPTDTPCGTCPSCIELSRAGGGSLDVVEIDAASHGGVDDARELRERAVFAPARDRYKIFIIDEAHMVTSGGFNALLKIVEEPPPHVKFIFATTEPEKVIGTIRSRTHHYPFRLIAPGTLIDYVQALCDSEGVEIEPGVLPLVVRAGGGSVRDTLSILDQLIAGSEQGRVTLDRATGLLGFTGGELIDAVAAALGAGDAAAAFAATDRVVQTGQDPRRFVEDLLERLRDLIVVSATTVQGAAAVFRGVPDDQLQRMFEQAQAFGPGQLSRIADTVSAALDKMSGATAPRLHLELMVARALVGARIAAAGSAPAAGSPDAAPARPAPNIRQALAGGTGAPPAAPASEPAVRTAPAPPAPAPVPQASAGGSGAPIGGAQSSEGAPGASATAATVDIVATLKSARDFLNGDAAGASRPPIVPLGGHPPQPTAAATPSAPAAPNTAGDPSASSSATAPAPTPTTAGAGESSAPVPADPARTEPAGPTASAESGAPVSDAPVGIDELREVWPELLEELLEADREAWNAVRNVQPLALDGDVLAVGLASRSDLEAFKAVGAGPLREAIAAAVGIGVKYVPRQLPPGAEPPSTDQQAPPEADQEPSPPSDRTEAAAEYREPPAPGWATLPPEPEPEPVAAAEPIVPQTGQLPPATGPAESALAAPAEPSRHAPGEFGDPGFDPEQDPDYNAAYDPDLGGGAEDPWAELPDPMPSAAPSAPPAPRSAPPESSAGSRVAPAASSSAAPAAVVPEPAGSAESAAPAASLAPSAAAPAAARPGGLLASLQAAAEQAAAETPTVENVDGPSFERYGEAVVREVLGARFIEERPLPQGEV